MIGFYSHDRGLYLDDWLIFKALGKRGWGGGGNLSEEFLKNLTKLLNQQIIFEEEKRC